MHRKIVCLGDSLTFGNIGYSYIDFLNKQSCDKYINKGKNGDTLIGLYNRLNKLIEKILIQKYLFLALGQMTYFCHI